MAKGMEAEITQNSSRIIKMVIVVVSVEGEKGKEDARATLLSIANPLKSVEFCQGIFITTR